MNSGVIVQKPMKDNSLVDIIAFNQNIPLLTTLDNRKWYFSISYTCAYVH